MIQATFISKEEIPKLKIPNREVLSTPEEIQARKSDLENAMRLGNNDHNKVKLIFQTEEGVMMVETTVWEVTQNYVLLKSNTHLPIRSIYRIDFFD
jgi:hypothetical protein